MKYAIDPDNCIYLTKGKCGLCEKNCPSEAINFKDTEKNITVKAGSLIAAPGFQSFDPTGLEQYSYANLPDVVTSLEFERILSATGPYGGQLARPSSMQGKNPEGEHPKKIAWLQCVGSRDINRCTHGYCSSVCCMYAVKQSIIAKEHARDELDCAIFYMDLRAQGKDFDRYCENAKNHGVRFIPARIHTVSPITGTNDLLLRYVDSEGSIRDETFEMVVLSTGLEISSNSAGLAKILGIELDHDRFTQTDCFHPVATSAPGIYACGVFTGPKDIPQSVMEASAAACAATENLAGARNTQTRTFQAPAERDVRRESPRIGIFVCNCGINIGGVVRVPEVVEYARDLPGVVYVEENLFTCSQDTQDKITAIIREKELNRVVIAACTPRTHETLFQETLVNAGLNKYLIEMANIRNQDSWVHANNPDAATQKAKDLVRMAVARSFLAGPLQENELQITQSAMVVGGGLAGLTVSLSLARHGFPVHLVEKSEYLGGNARHLNKTFQNEDIGKYLEKIIQQVESEPNITVHKNTTIMESEGFVGNFKTTLSNNSSQKTVDHGVVILSTGASEYKPHEYLYGEHEAVVTNIEMDKMFKADDPRIKQAHNLVFIQCVGSRNKERPYCSKVCCTHSIRNALDFKTRNPEANVYILYRDIRTYGKRESLYTDARKQGVIFFRYEPEEKPEVSENGKQVTVSFKDPVLGRKLSFDADILCLASSIIPNDDSSLIQMFKVGTDEDGWLAEAHQKLQPVEFATEGIF
ncbi:MAG: FAD-dependent oxidoreductase, partial [Desulfobacterales bacterium]